MRVNSFRYAGGLTKIQVPAFKWHIIDAGVSFEIDGTGVQVLPFCGA